MNCENKFCIYFESDTCILNPISLDELGLCKQMCYVDIDEEFLDFKRKKLLAKFEQLDK